MSKKDESTSSGMLRALAHLTQIGITIVICVALGLLIGWYLDRLLGTAPWLMLVFIIMGIGAALKSIIDFSKRL